MLDNDVLLSRNYRVINQMRPGTGGTVFVVLHTISNEKNVLKFSFVSVEERKRFEEQIKYWKELCTESENVVLLKDFFFDNSNACVIMEYCEEGDLETLIKKRKLENGRFSEDEILRVLIHVVSGLKAMHKRKIIHRDIKTANILVCKGMVFKVADFNVSQVASGTFGTASTMAGTILYSAPEMLNEESYTFSVDMYSVGVVLYELMTLRNPFTSLSKILAGEYPRIDEQLGYSAGLMDLVKRLLSRNPSDRPSADAVLDIPFVLRGECRMMLMEERRKMEKVLETLLKANEQRQKEQDEKIAALEMKNAQIEMALVSPTSVEQPTGKTMFGKPTYVVTFEGTYAETTVLASNWRNRPVAYGGYLISQWNDVTPIPCADGGMVAAVYREPTKADLVLRVKGLGVKNPYKIWVEYVKD